MMRNTLGSLMIVIITALASCGAQGREIERDYHKTYDVSPGYGLRLKNGDGNVFIKRWDKDVLDIKVEYLAEYKSIGAGERDFKVNFRTKNDIIEVTEVETSTPVIGFHIFNIKEYSYTIFAPDYLTLEINGDDGEIYIDDWRANIEISLDDGAAVLRGIECDQTIISIEDGELNIGDHKGNLEIDYDDGRIEIFRCSIPECIIRGEDGPLSIRDTKGDFDIELDDGDADIYRLLTENLHYQGGDGDLEMEILRIDDIDIDIRTDDGDIDLDLEEGISAKFSIDVDDARIRIDLPSGTIIEKDENWVSGKLRDGKGRIRIRTSDGNVNLREIR
ncbi:MAG: DUF4097 family beta strand repeat protein [Candidatus Krumholzibacteriota bacterium]|nr:DUF4097 family beta strand repeat protein [Candidatus Krumholzibacteriota bacterium]